jgi:hypothetical protein
MRSRTYIIYALIAPRDDSIRYIGLTEYPDIRLKQQIEDDGNIHKRKWVNELNRLGLSPIMQTIETVQTLPEAFEREGYWIQYYLNMGARLVNIRPSYSVRGIGTKLSSSASNITDGKQLYRDKLINSPKLCQSDDRNIHDHGYIKLSSIKRDLLDRI